MRLRSEVVSAHMEIHICINNLLHEQFILEGFICKCYTALKSQTLQAQASVSICMTTLIGVLDCISCMLSHLAHVRQICLIVEVRVIIMVRKDNMCIKILLFVDSASIGLLIQIIFGICILAIGCSMITKISCN